MKLFIVTADTEKIKKVNRIGVIAEIATNPSFIKKKEQILLKL